MASPGSLRSLLKYAVCAGLVWVCCPELVGQTRESRFQACLDSCHTAMQDGSYADAMRHWNEAWSIAEAGGDTAAMGDLLVRRSNMEQMQGDYNKALSDLYAAQRIFEAQRHEEGLADVYNAIGAIHHYDRNYGKARQYYAQSMAIRERLGSEQDLAILYGNIGSLLEEMGRPDSALAYHRRNLGIRTAVGEPKWIAVACSNLGWCHDKLGAFDSARHYLERSMAIVEREGSRFLKSHTGCLLGLVLIHGGEVRPGVQRCQAALQLADAMKNLPLQEQCYDCLFQGYEALGDHTRALNMHKRHVAARDSMFGQARAKELLRIELTYNFERQLLADSLARLDAARQAEFAYQQRIGRERDQKRLFLYGGIGVLLLAGGLWSRLRYMRRSRNLVQRERDRSDRLLLNILPRPIAEELKEHGRAKAREVDQASILFTDFDDFTQLSEHMNAQELVTEIDACFSAFDAIVVRYGLEKIKTIGDAYMCAGGLPAPREGSARDTVLAALEMQEWLTARARERQAAGRPFFTMRAGIHTGPVIAGIVGDTKFQYDVWGDTVNIAARMESGGEVGKVNISEATCELVKEQAGTSTPLGVTRLFDFTPRGKVQAKGKGELEMYFVRRSSEASSVDFVRRSSEGA